MDVSEKRVLRRRASAIADKLRLTEGIAVQGYRQGLLDYQGLVSVLEFRRNRDRVLQFLELMEEVRPAGFEKLCYFLENHGNSRLCDELWVELICEKGHLRLNPEVLDEVRGLVRARLGDTARLEPEDLEELTVMIASRYQTAKTALMRQDRRIPQRIRYSALERSGVGWSQEAAPSQPVSDPVEDLCTEVQQCMAGMMNSRSSSGVEARTRTGTQSSGGQKDSSLRPILRYQYSDASSSWVKELKKKLTNLSNTQVPPERFSVRGEAGEIPPDAVDVPAVGTTCGGIDANKSQPANRQSNAAGQGGTDNRVVHGVNASNVMNSDAGRARLQALMAAHSQAAQRGGKAPPSVVQDFADALREMHERSVVDAPKDKGGKAKVSRTRLQQLIHPNIRVKKVDSDKEGASEGTGVRGRTDDVTMPSETHTEHKRKAAKVEKVDRQAMLKKIKAEKAKAEKLKRKLAKANEEQDFKPPDFRILTEAEEASIQREVHNLHRSKHHISNMRRSISAVASERLERGLTQLEDSYWKRRCELMKRCQATGYYYFLSSHKRHRCHACLETGPTPYNQCAWFEPQDEIHINRLGSAHLQRPELNLYRASSYTDMDDFDSFVKILTGEPRTKAVKFDDCQCPGAIDIPGQKFQRCLACAYANEEVAQFYDAAVSTEGSYHLSFPTVEKYIPAMKAKVKATASVQAQS